MSLTLAKRLMRPSTTAQRDAVAPTHAEVEPADGVPDAVGIEIRRGETRTTVRMWGEHDRSTADVISTKLVEAIAIDDRHVVVDLDEVTFMDCSTVAALVHGRALLVGRDRRLTVRLPPPAQRRLLELCGLGDLIENDALGAASRRQPTTPLETWVAVPPTERRVEGRTSPVEARQPQEGARRGGGSSQ